MSYILGMDTGGTYTDGVIIDSSDRIIISKAKAFTTKENLATGIANCIEKLQLSHREEIKLVSLSTTLATNAIVEGRGGTVGLIYMGAELESSVPANEIVKIKGRFDIMGNLVEKPDKDEVRQVLTAMKGQVDAIVISGYASVRNPDHENEVKYMAREILDIPVVCAHQLTSALGFHHRTVTATLNGRLIPIINKLLASTKSVLRQQHIDAPVMIVKGDGLLMTEDMAKSRPIETILSGPAASIIGGLALTGKKDGIILDMGGTTTDISHVSNGIVRTKKEGAKVGGWATRIQAAEISTFGLGGDSRIFLDEKGGIHIGPEKVWPLCIMGEIYPNLAFEIERFRRRGELKQYFPSETDCYLFVGKKNYVEVSATEKTIIDSLIKGPHSITYLAKLTKQNPEAMNLDALVKAGVLARISVTPTDILRFSEKYSEGNKSLSAKGIEILAARKEISPDKFADTIENMVRKKLAIALIQSGADFDDQNFSFEDDPAAMYLIERSFKEKPSALLDPVLHLKKPVIAIGAPAGAWVSEIIKYIDADIFVPNDADVANAYGAAVSQITETIEIRISLTDEGYILNTPWKRTAYKSKDEATFYAIHEGRQHIEHLMMNAGCRSWIIEEKPEDMFLKISDDDTETYIGTKIHIKGVGKAI